MLRANNLSDVISTSAARANIGAGTGDMLKANNLSDVANAATARTNLGAGDMLKANNLSDVANPATARANIGAGVGDMLKTDNLSGIANPATARTNIGAGDMLKANNLSDVTNAATARANIGAGTGDMKGVNNLTDVANAATARANLGAGDMLKSDNLSGLANYTTARSNLGLGALATKTTALYGDIDSTALGTLTDILQNNASKLATPNAIWGAGAQINNNGNVTGSVTLNSQFINQLMTLTGNITLQLPTNQRIGQSGLWWIAQDGTGGRTVSFAGGFSGFNGIFPTVDARPNTYTMIFYFIVNTNLILVSGGPWAA